jgi:hypothetical protein
MIQGQETLAQKLVVVKGVAVLALIEVLAKSQRLHWQENLQAVQLSLHSGVRDGLGMGAQCEYVR